MIMKSRLMSALVCLALGATLVAQSNEDLPRRQFESGLAFLKGQRYAEALKDFQGADQPDARRRHLGKLMKQLGAAGQLPGGNEQGHAARAL